jgi:hypothetical protein
MLAVVVPGKPDFTGVLDGYPVADRTDDAIVASEGIQSFLGGFINQNPAT